MYLVWSTSWGHSPDRIGTVLKCCFLGDGKTGVSVEKPFGTETRTNNKLNPHMTRVRCYKRVLSTFSFDMFLKDRNASMTTVLL